MVKSNKCKIQSVAQIFFTNFVCSTSSPNQRPADIDKIRCWTGRRYNKFWRERAIHSYFWFSKKPWFQYPFYCRSIFRSFTGLQWTQGIWLYRYSKRTFKAPSRRFYSNGLTNGNMAILATCLYFLKYQANEYSLNMASDLADLYGTIVTI